MLRWLLGSEFFVGWRKNIFDQLAVERLLLKRYTSFGLDIVYGLDFLLGIQQLKGIVWRLHSVW